MDDLILPNDQVPHVLSEWLATGTQPARLVAIERAPDGNVLLRSVPDIDPMLVVRIRETFAKYREALMNLT
jgi:hypothetical protein